MDGASWSGDLEGPKKTLRAGEFIKNLRGYISGWAQHSSFFSLFFSYNPKKLIWKWWRLKDRQACLALQTSQGVKTAQLGRSYIQEATYLFS